MHSLSSSQPAFFLWPKYTQLGFLWEFGTCSSPWSSKIISSPNPGMQSHHHYSWYTYCISQFCCHHDTSNYVILTWLFSIHFLSESLTRMEVPHGQRCRLFCSRVPSNGARLMAAPWSVFTVWISEVAAQSYAELSMENHRSSAQWRIHLQLRLPPRLNASQQNKFKFPLTTIVLRTTHHFIQHRTST